MSLPRFLADAVPDRPDRELVLAGAEGHHAVTVRRVRPGEQLEVGDGRGRVALCEVRSAAGSVLTCVVLDRWDEPAPAPKFVVLQALAKAERGELAVEVMTELGVDAVVPWAAERSVARWQADRAARGVARWRATAREAAKQSHRAWVPEIRDPVTTPGAAALVRAATLALILDAAAAEPLAGLDVPTSGDVVVVAGPEGGITPTELAVFAAAGARAVRLGPTVLRTSTAGAAALAVLSARSGRWS